MQSLPPVARYRSMYRSRSTGELCPLMLSVECSSVVRLNTCRQRAGRGVSAAKKSAMGRPEETEAHPDAVLARGRDNFARVKLQRGDRVLVPDRVGDRPGPEVPDLRARGAANGVSGRFAWAGWGGVTGEAHPDGLVEAAADEVELVKLDAGDGAGVADERAVGLAGAHCERREKSQPCTPAPLREESDALSHIRTHPSPVPLASAYPQNCTPPTKSSYISQLPSA